MKREDPQSSFAHFKRYIPDSLRKHASQVPDLVTVVVEEVIRITGRDTVLIFSKDLAALPPRLSYVARFVRADGSTAEREVSLNMTRTLGPPAGPPRLAMKIDDAQMADFPRGSEIEVETRRR